MVPILDMTLDLDPSHVLPEYRSPLIPPMVPPEYITYVPSKMYLQN